MNEVKPSMAGPKRPQDRVLLSDMAENYRKHSHDLCAARRSTAEERFINEGGDIAIHDANEIPPPVAEPRVRAPADTT